MLNSTEPTANYLRGGHTTSGELDFRSSDRPDVPLSELRQGLAVKVKREGYKEVYSSVPADLLKPSNEARRYSVQLEKDWSALTAAIAALEPRVAAWNGDAGEKPSQSMLTGDIELALLARKRAEELSKEIEAAREAFGIGLIPGTTGASCRKKATQLKEDIQVCEAEANQKAQELNQILDGASIIAANCSSPKDGDTIKNEYGTAIKLLAEIGKRNKKADKDRDDLLLLAQESLALKTLLAEMQNKVSEIGDQANAVAEVATSVANEFKRLADISKSLMTREIALNSELAVLEVKYNVNTDTTIPRDLTRRVDAMRQLLGSRNDFSFGKVPEASLPEGVSSAVTTIDGIKNNADHLLRQYQAAICEIDTMDQTESSARPCARSARHHGLNTNRQPEWQRLKWTIAGQCSPSI
jgi:hypothetical protein